LAAHADRAATGLVRGVDAGTAKDDAAGREVRTRDVLHQLRQLDLWIVDERNAAVDQLAQIVRRNVGRHADGNTARAVGEQVREARRQHLRLDLRTVIVVLE